VRRLLVSFAVVLVVVTGDALAKKEPVNVQGSWSGAEASVLNVNREGRDADAAFVSLEVDGQNWSYSDGERTYTGTWAQSGRKMILTYSSSGLAATAAGIAEWIEGLAAMDGLSIDVSVTIVSVNAKAKAKETRKRGKTMKVKSKVKFSATATGDLNISRKGSLKVKALLTPDS
jgi:hypothetical protein